MNESYTLNLVPLKAKVKHDEIKLMKLHLSANTLGKALHYLRISYNAYVRTSDVSTVARQLRRQFEIDEDGVSIAEQCELHVMNFLYNLHIVCDQFPYVVKCSIEKPLQIYNRRANAWEEVDEFSVGWNDKTLRAIQNLKNSASFHKAVLEFKQDEGFKLLKRIVNKAKHAHFPDITSDLSGVKIKVYDFEEKRISVYSCDEVLTVLHNRLVPKIICLYERLIQFQS